MEMADAPITPRKDSSIAPPSAADSFLDEIRQLASPPASSRGRLIYALDATASRQPTWDTACKLQAEMFQEVAAVGGLEMQLVYYRGLGECRASTWISHPEQLAKTMSQIMCNAGQTQIGKILTHAQKETKLLRVSGLIFVGDAMEEAADELICQAGDLGQSGVPAFMFQEGTDRQVEEVFRAIATRTRGAYCRFDSGAARQLSELLKAVAVFATGGLPALAQRPDASSIKLLGQLK
jgi:hypothetical protein